MLLHENYHNLGFRLKLTYVDAQDTHIVRKFYEIDKKFGPTRISNSGQIVNGWNQNYGKKEKEKNHFQT